MKSHISKFIITFFLTSSVNYLNAGDCPADSISCRPSFTSTEEKSHEISGYSINGLVEGTIKETDDKLIINGAKFVIDGDTESAISVGKNYKKEVIINNTQIISNDFNQKINDDISGIVKIDSDDSIQNLTINDLTIDTNNSNISSRSSSNEVCAALLCTRLSSGDEVRGVSVNNTGVSNIEAERY